MQQQTRTTALSSAIVAGLLSLPMTWMTIQGAQIQGGFGQSFNAAFGGMTIDVTGLNGHVTFLFKTPIWFIVGVGIAASVLQLMQKSATFSAPRPLQWGTAIVAVVWVGIAISVALFSSQASLGLGALLGLFCAAMPLACLLMPNPTTTSGPNQDELPAD